MGETPELLDPLDYPFTLDYVYRWFHELTAKRHYSENGMPQQTSWQDIKAWCDLTETKPTPNDINIINTLDLLVCKHKMPRKK